MNNLIACGLMVFVVMVVIGISAMLSEVEQ